MLADASVSACFIYMKSFKNNKKIKIKKLEKIMCRIFICILITCKTCTSVIYMLKIWYQRIIYCRHFGENSFCYFTYSFL